MLQLKRYTLAGPLLLVALLAGLRVAASPPPGPTLEPLAADPATDPWFVLAALEGAGPRLGQRLVAYRETVGPLDRTSKLLRVPGVGANRLDRWLAFLHQGAPASLAPPATRPSPRVPAVPGTPR